MKNTRSYLLGVGSGLMLSALLSIGLTIIGLQDLPLNIFPNAEAPSTAANSSTPNQPTRQNSSQSETMKAFTPDSNSNTTLPIVPKNPTVPSTSSPTAQIKTPSIPTSSSSPGNSNPQEPSTKTAGSQFEKQLVIPNGASSERIAELLFGQGLITDKTKFLETVDKRGVAEKFRVGTYTILPGLTSDEIINRLISGR